MLFEVGVAVAGQGRVEQHRAAAADTSRGPDTGRRRTPTDTGCYGGRQEGRHHRGSGDRLVVVCGLSPPPLHRLVVRLLLLGVLLLCLLLCLLCVSEPSGVLTEDHLPAAAGRVVAAAVFQLDAVLHVCQR